MKRKHLLLATMLSATLLASYAGLAESAEAIKEMASEFTLQTFDNREIRLGDFKGKAVVVWFMASW